MQSALRIETQILPGNKIEIELPPENTFNAVGKTVEVILLLPEKTAAPTCPSIVETLAAIHAQRPIGRSVEEINQDLQAERAAWDG